MRIVIAAVLIVLLSASIALADALEDDTHDPGVSYYDGGSGWQDLVVDLSWWGNNIMHAEVSCCSDPVATQIQSMGSLKARYR